jgi:hypothetical protein
LCMKVTVLQLFEILPEAGSYKPLFHPGQQKNIRK